MPHQLYFLRQEADLGRITAVEGDVAQWPEGCKIWQWRDGAWVPTAETQNQPAALFGPQPTGSGFLHIADGQRDATVPDGLTQDIPVVDNSESIWKTLHFVKGLLVEITDGISQRPAGVAIPGAVGGTPPTQTADPDPPA